MFSTSLKISWYTETCIKQKYKYLQEMAYRQYQNISTGATTQRDLSKYSKLYNEIIKYKRNTEIT